MTSLTFVFLCLFYSEVATTLMDPILYEDDYTFDIEPRRRFRRSPLQTYNNHYKTLNNDLMFESPGEDDILLMDAVVIKEKLPGRVIYQDIVFNDQSYDAALYVCPFNITAISIKHQGLDEKAGYPIVMYGGIGEPEVLILFVSQRDESINFTVKIWGKEYNRSYRHNNLLEGIPKNTDDLLLYTIIQQNAQIGNDKPAGTVSYEKPVNRTVKITSVQAWDLSTGCKLGGSPIITKGGVGFDFVEVQVKPEKYGEGFQYIVLVLGEFKSLFIGNENAG